MDFTSSSSTCPKNWLAFTLSNNHPYSSSHSSNLSLFRPNPTTFLSDRSGGGIVNGAAEQKDASGPTDYCILSPSGSPKLEDFFGGRCAIDSSNEVCQFNTAETPATTVSDAEIYDSELKNIAASFLRNFSADRANTASTTQNLAVAPIADPPAAKKAVDTFGQRTSIYRGVTRHRWTGRYEAHLWDNSCRREGQSRKGRQVYLGGYDKEDKAARAYDLAALKYWGSTTTTNFPVINYEKELEEMNNMTRQEFVASLRRKSSGFSRGASIYRGVTRHHQHGRWQARIGRVAGNKDLYLGTFSTQEEAAEAYDIAAIKFRGLNAVTNFDMSRYDVKSIASSTLPIEGIANKSNKTSPNQSASHNRSTDGSRSDERDLSSASSVTFVSAQPATSTLSFALPIKPDTSDYWSILNYHNACLIDNNDARTSGAGTTTAYFQGTTPFSMEYLTSETTAGNSNGYLNGGYLQQQNSCTPASISLATPISIDGNINSSPFEGSVLGNWVEPSLHSFQRAKPNLSVFQTPIFGME